MMIIPDELETREGRATFMRGQIARTIAAQIKGLREAHGLTQETLANELGTQQPSIAKWESGTYCGYSVDTLIKIACYFDVALVVRFVGWPEFLAFYPSGEVAIPKRFCDSPPPLSEER